MKRNLLKTLLVAVGLVMGVNGIWGQTKNVLYSQTFDNLDAVPTDWTQSSGSLTLVTDGNNKYLKETSAGSGSRPAWYTGNAISTATKNIDNWTIEFDCLIAEGTNVTNYSQGVWILGTDLSNSWGAPKGYIIGVVKGSNKSTYTIQLSGADTENTVNLTSNTFYHYIFTYDKESKTLDMTIQNADKTTDIYKKNFTYDVTSKGDLTSVFIQAGRGTSSTAGFTCIDNIEVSTISTQEIVAAPQATITAINGVKRTVAITAQDNSHEIYYYLGDDSTNPIKYDKEFEVSESTTLHYYAQSTSGAKSEIQNMDIKCVEIQLVSPTAFRTGATSYRLYATQPETSGLTPTATIHYSLNGEEGTITDGGELTNVNDDIITWASAEGYKDSEKATISHIAAYTTTEVWSYDLNSFPATYSTTSIANAIDTETETTLNDLTVYNLKNINKPNLFIENADGWLLRNQSSNAFKIQSAATTITFNNVTPQNVIYIKGVDDQGRYRISSIINGSVAYSYSNNEYFIVPNAEGAVTVTFNTGVSIYTVGVQALAQTVSVTDAGLATYCPSYGLDFTNAENIAAYKASVSGNEVTLTKVTTVAKGEGVLLRSINGGAAEENIAVNVDATKNDGNAFVGTLEDITVNETDGDNTNYVLSKENDVMGFYKAAVTGTNVAAGKAYLPVLTSNAAKGIKVVFDGETTGISTVKDNTAKDNTIYNLNGQRVAAPAKGLYIMNGKKVVIK